MKPPKFPGHFALPLSVKNLIFVVICGLLACFLSYQWSDFIADFLHFEYLGVNVRATLLSEKPKTQSHDITIVAIDSDELASKPFVIPMDRGYLSDVLLKLAAYKPKRIVIDVLYDRHSVPADDLRLQQTLKTLNVPVVLAYADERTPDEDQPYQMAFLKATGRPFGYANLLEKTGEEADNFEVTHIPQSVDGHCSLSDLAASNPAGDPTCLHGAAKPRAIDWLLMPRDGRPNFATMRPRDINPLTPADALRLQADPCDEKTPRPPIVLGDFVATRTAPFLHCRIVFLGAMLSYQDTHKTPVSSFGDFTGAEKLDTPSADGETKASPREIPGLIIQAFATQQLLDGRSVHDFPAIANFVFVLIAGLLGAAVMTLPKVEEFPRFCIFLGSLTFILLDILVEAVSRTLFPGNMVVVAFALGIFLHLARFKWRHEQHEAEKEETGQAFRPMPFVKAFFRLIMEILG
jgi:hypothetical protein